MLLVKSFFVILCIDFLCYKNVAVLEMMLQMRKIIVLEQVLKLS